MGSAAEKDAGPAGPVRDARPGPPGERSKPPIRMLDQTLMLGGAAGNELLGAAGSWHEVRDAISAEFHPTAELVSTESKPLAVVKQLTQGAPMRSAPPTMVTAIVEPTGELDSAGQADAARAAYERPTSVRKVELSAVIEADGRLSTITVLSPSGNSAFDDAAVGAVRRALRDRPRVEADESPAGRPPGRVVARLRVAAGRAVELPHVMPAREPVTANARHPVRGLIGGATGTFDETTGFVKADRPFGNRITTQVELISVGPAPTPTPQKPAVPRTGP